MKNEIILKQAPVISHELEKIGKQVTERIESLNIDSLVPTEDALKSLKTTTADLNKELKKFEEQRKSVKQGVNKPYVEFEDVYKAEISEKYTNAVNKLKSKIDSVEMQIKDKKRNELIQYFDDLCAAEKIDFLHFENAGVDVKLSVTLKAYKEQINEFIERVKSDLSLIDTEKFAAEILVEYKKNLNASQSITVVRQRKKAEAEEAERIRQKSIIDRKNALKKLGFQEVSFTKSINFNDEIYFTEQEIEALSREQFKEKYLKFEAEIAEINKQKQSGNYEVAYVAEKPKSEPLQAPVVEEQVKKLTATFEAYGTMEQLKSIGQFMRENGIEYKNL